MIAISARACPRRCRFPCRWRAGEPQRYTHDGLVLRGGGFLEADMVVYATGRLLGPGCSTTGTLLECSIVTITTDFSLPCARPPQGLRLY